MKKEKHDHKLTNILKFCCFALLMAMPLLQTCGKMLYVALNPNAKNEYTMVDKIQANLQNNPEKTPDYISFVRTNVITNLPTNTTYNLVLRNVNNQNVYTIAIWTNVNGSSSLGGITKWIENENELFYIYDQIYENDIQNFINLNKIELVYITENEGTSSLINTIENSHEKQMTNGILSWVDDTIAYNGINAMMTGLNITDRYIIYLISYWIMLTVIYVVVDIIIFAFTYLTHFFNN